MPRVVKKTNTDKDKGLGDQSKTDNEGDSHPPKKTKNPSSNKFQANKTDRMHKGIMVQGYN